MENRFLPWRECARVGATPETVSTELAEPDPGVIALGENAHFNVLGKPLHASAIGVSNDPACIFAVICSSPDSPGAIVTADGDALNETLGAGGGGAGGGGEGHDCV